MLRIILTLLQPQPLPKLLHQRRIIQFCTDLMTNRISELFTALAAMVITMR